MDDPVLTQNPPFYFPKRGCAQPGPTLWQRPTTDQFTICTGAFQQWLSDIEKEQALFKLNVYENSNLTESDLRQHREHLCGLLSIGESVALAFMSVGKQPDKAKDVIPYINLIDQKLKELFSVLFAWHGPLQGQSDIPESFKQAVSEADAGNLVELDVYTPAWISETTAFTNST